MARRKRLVDVDCGVVENRGFEMGRVKGYIRGLLAWDSLNAWHGISI